MIVPTSNLPVNPAMLANDNGEQPSQTNLLIAAAEMHKLGRFSDQPPRFKSPHPTRAKEL